MHERRTSPRARVAIDIEERTDGVTYFQRSHDISETGVHLASTLPHPPGTRVSLSLRLPNSAVPLTIDGTVVARSADELGMAIAFSRRVPMAVLASAPPKTNKKNSTKTLS